MQAFVRDARPDDMAAISEIYAHEVLHGHASFELTPPSQAEMQERFEQLKQKGYPYLVAELAGDVAGYAYVGPYRSRPAYRFTIENSVYVNRDFAGKGIGRNLLNQLITDCKDLGFRQMIAVIGNSENLASIQMHKACGFEMVGVLRNVGWKNGRWLDTVMMQKRIGEGADTPPVDR